MAGGTLGLLAGGVGLLLSAGAASAAGGLSVRPASVAPGELVAVRGTCPAPTNGAYVRATVGVASLDRYVVVPVSDGAFRASVPVEPAGSATDPVPGDRLAVEVTCATEASFVTTVGTRRVRVVSDSEAAALDQAGSGEVGAAASGAAQGAMSPVVPLIAFAVAAVGTVAAFAVSRRSDRRAEAMAGHPAQRGLGRAPRRARR